MIIKPQRWIPQAISFGILVCFQIAAQAADVHLRVTPRFELSISGATLVAPDQGLWMIGTGWSEHRPQRESHASPTEVTTVDSWHVLNGVVETPDGPWQIEDQFRLLDDGLVQGRRRWTYAGDQPSGPVVLTIQFQVDAPESSSFRPFLPGINYFGNPSGTRVAAERVPTWTGQPGCEGLYEEHRYPMPFASVEADSTFVAALHSRPSQLPFGARRDLWWSLGLIQTPRGVALNLQSGPVASNGQRGTVKARQEKFLPYPRAHLTGIPPGTVI
ncbi:MAG: hypothetical protein AAF745_00835, partial [Planctomycetota bacterium]